MLVRSLSIREYNRHIDKGKTHAAKHEPKKIVEDARKPKWGNQTKMAFTFFPSRQTL